MKKEIANETGLLMNNDQTGGTNQTDIICNHCHLTLLPKQHATKMTLPAYLSYDFQGDFEPLMDYWKIRKMTDFSNVQITSRDGNVSLLSCIRCDSQIIGLIFNNIGKKEIYLNCNRTHLT